MDVPHYRWEFDGFTLDQRTWTLLGPDGEAVSLTPKAFDALLYFVEHAGIVIDRAKLIEVLWPNTVVEENNLRQIIAALRRALGEEFIKTVPRRGYQFVAAVRVIDAERAGESATAGVTSAQPETPRRLAGVGTIVGAALLALIAAAIWYGVNQPVLPLRLAVLPFTDTSPDGNLEHVADALSMDLLTTLALVDGLEVPGSTSSFWFRNNPSDLATVRDLLDADYILEGDVRSADERLRISVRLTDAAAGSQLWSESFDRVVDDLFVLQDEIVRTVTQALEISLGVGELGTRLGTTRNPEAFFALMEADRIRRESNRFLPEGARAVIPHLERAVTLDPDFAIGWFELYWQSRWLDILATDTGVAAPGARERAAAALERVEALAPNLPELMIAKLQTSADAYDIAVAMEQLLDEAANVEYPPAIVSLTEALYLRFTGRLRESMTAAERGLAFDPLNERFVSVLARGLSAEGRHTEALALIDEFVSRTGTSGFGAAVLEIALVLGDPAEIARRTEPSRTSLLPIVRELASNMDDPDYGLSLLREFVASPDPRIVLWPTILSIWAAYFGDDELALEMYRHEAPYATGNTISRPILAGMRQLPGFRDLVRDIGLLSYWRESGHWPDYCRPLDSEAFECF